jgi:hypothetical protein
LEGSPVQTFLGICKITKYFTQIIAKNTAV